MHYRLLVTFEKGSAVTSEEARRYVEQELLNDPSFSGGGRFGGAMADWFVIGGRWSGELSRATWGRAVEKQNGELQKKEKLQVWGAYYGNKKMREAQARLKQQVEELYAGALPQEYRDKDLVYDRDRYRDRDMGYEDDAMLLTQELYDSLLAEYAGDFIAHSQYVVAFVDLDYDPLDPEFVGKKWLVVVDAHT